MGDYTIDFAANDKMQVQISCRTLKSVYRVSHGSLEIEVNPSLWGDCAENTMDAIFMNDLNRVVDYQVFHDALVLELGSGAGAMFFEPMEKPAP